MSFIKKISLAIVAFVTVPFTALAHVRYIATPEEIESLGKPDYAALLSPLSEPKYIIMMVATVIVVLGVYFYLNHNKYFHKWAIHMQHVGESYRPYIPWITRLSLGIILIGGATKGFLISPVLDVAFPWIALVQLVIGFFLMAGFLVGFSAVIAFALFIYTLVQDPYLIGSFDILALIISLLVLDSRRPGVDDIIGIPDFLHIRKLRKYLPTILRVGIGVGMAYLAVVEKIMTPHLAAHVAEVTELTSVIPVSAMMWTFAAGVIEFVVGLLLVIGFKTRLASVAALFILSMSFFYFGEDVTSHVTLFGTLSAVFILGVGPLGIDKPHHF